jgi:membrane protein implicated in regulation of membrane protease activity
MSIDPALVWFLIGVGLALLELAVPGVILIFFGVGAWIAAFTTWAGLTPGPQGQLLVFAAASVLLLVGLRKWIHGWLYGHVSDVQDLTANLDEFTGKPVEVLEDVIPGRPGGRVEFKGATWSASSHESLRKGESAVIERVDGIELVIKKNLEGQA